MVDLKPAYRAATKDAAEVALDELNVYLIVIEFWLRKWVNLSVYFTYPN